MKLDESYASELNMLFVSSQEIENILVQYGDYQYTADEAARKIQELRDSRATDTIYVVHMARIECSYGLRYSMLGLNQIHGMLAPVFTSVTADKNHATSIRLSIGGVASIEGKEVEINATENLTSHVNRHRNRGGHRNGLDRLRGDGSGVPCLAEYGHEWIRQRNGSLCQ